MMIFSSNVALLFGCILIFLNWWNFDLCQTNIKLSLFEQYRKIRHDYRSNNNNNWKWIGVGIYHLEIFNFKINGRLNMNSENWWAREQKFNGKIPNFNKNENMTFQSIQYFFSFRLQIEWKMPVYWELKIRHVVVCFLFTTVFRWIDENYSSQIIPSIQFLHQSTFAF